MIVLFLLFIRFLPWGSSSSTGAGDSREALGKAANATLSYE